MIRWPTPHSSAHWPRYVWPASVAGMSRSNWLSSIARDDVALEQELRDVERVDDVRAVQEQVGRLRRPAGSGRRPGRSGAVIVKTGSVVALASAGRYSNDHWNWPATARTLRSGSALDRLDAVQRLPRDDEQEDAR